MVLYHSKSVVDIERMYNLVDCALYFNLVEYCVIQYTTVIQSIAGKLFRIFLFELSVLSLCGVEKQIRRKINKKKSIFFFAWFWNRNSNFKTIYFLIYIGFRVTPTISLTKYVKKRGNCNLYFYDALWHSHQTSLFTIMNNRKGHISVSGTGNQIY